MVYLLYFHGIAFAIGLCSAKICAYRLRSLSHLPRGNVRKHLTHRSINPVLLNCGNPCWNDWAITTSSKILSFIMTLWPQVLLNTPSFNSRDLSVLYAAQNGGVEHENVWVVSHRAELNQPEPILMGLLWQHQLRSGPTLDTTLW